MPQVLWFKRVRTNVPILFLLSIVVNVGMWLERFIIIVTSLHRDFLPSSWGRFQPTFWDFSIFLDVDFETAIERAERRDLELFGSAANVRARYEQRYVPGQRLYFARCNPNRRATLVVDNTDPNRPAIMREV